MYIKTENNNVVLKGKELSAMIVTSGSKARKYSGDIILSSHQLEVDDGSFLVANPGEYEVKEAFVYALDTNESDEANIFSVLVDDVQIVYLNAETKDIDKSVIEQIGLDNILIMDFVDDKDLVARLKLVSAFDPGVFIPLTDDDDLAKKIANELGTEVPDRESKFKYEESDFADEERSMELALFAN